MTRRPPPQEKQPGFFANLLFNILLPVVILMQLSGEERLGPVLGIIVALAFPIGYGSWDLYKRKKVNGFSIIGLISVLLTGGISLLELDPKYIAIKEAAVPALFGIVIYVSQFTRFPLVQKLLLNRQLMDIEGLNEKLEENNNKQAFDKTVNRAAYGVVAAFMLSAVLNYILARMIVVSPAGTEAFNNELGRMTALSFPVIVLPTMIVMVGAMLYLFSRVHKLTGQSIDEFMWERDKG